MIRGIDHLVIACADPDAAAAELEARLGLEATGGGHHPGGGTRNRIAWLADGSYLELIGVDDPDLARQSPVGAAALAVLESGGGGLATYALADDNLELTAGALRAAGAPLGEPGHGRRERGDGVVVEWWAAMPERPLAPDAPPFLIQHVATGAEWGPGAVAERTRQRHPIGSRVILARLDIAAGDPPGAAAALHEVTGLDVRAVADLAVAEVGAHVIRLLPRREMAVPAAVVLAAEIEAPISVEALGLRFDVERAELPVIAGGG